MKRRRVAPSFFVTFDSFHDFIDFATSFWCVGRSRFCILKESEGVDYTKAMLSQNFNLNFPDSPFRFLRFLLHEAKTCGFFLVVCRLQQILQFKESGRRLRGRGAVALPPICRPCQMNVGLFFLRFSSMTRKRVGASFLLAGDDVRLNFTLLFSVFFTLFLWSLFSKAKTCRFVLLFVGEDVSIVFSNFNLCFQRFSNLFSSLLPPPQAKTVWLLLFGVSVAADSNPGFERPSNLVLKLDQNPINPRRGVTCGRLGQGLSTGQGL